MGSRRFRRGQIALEHRAHRGAPHASIRCRHRGGDTSWMFGHVHLEPPAVDDDQRAVRSRTPPRICRARRWPWRSCLQWARSVEGIVLRCRTLLRRLRGGCGGRRPRVFGGTNPGIEIGPAIGNVRDCRRRPQGDDCDSKNGSVQHLMTPSGWHFTRRLGGKQRISVRRSVERPARLSGDARITNSTDREADRGRGCAAPPRYA